MAPVLKPTKKKNAKQTSGAKRDPSVKRDPGVKQASGGKKAAAEKSSDKKPPRKGRRQIAALPFLWHEDGHVRVMLVTSRETRRWVIPKGWPMKGRKPYQAAEREAFEEAGVVGEIGKVSVGCYAYDKRLANGEVRSCEVDVFPLAVAERRERWPEMHERDSLWVSPREAADLVQEEGLRKILLSFDPSGLDLRRKARTGEAAGKPPVTIAS